MDGGLSPLVSAKACLMAKRRVGVEYSPSMLEPVRPGAVSPGRALCFPTFSHFSIVNKNFSTSLPFQAAVMLSPLRYTLNLSRIPHKTSFQ